MKAATMIARVLLGLGFVVFGANIIFPFLPQPPFPEHSPEAHFMELMVPSHYMTVVGVFQLVGGLLVLLGSTLPLGLVLLGPVLVNIILFHALIMGGAGLAPGLVFSALEAFLIYVHWDAFRGIFPGHRAK